MSNPGASRLTPTPVQGASAGPVSRGALNGVTRFPSTSACYPQAIADLDLAAAGGDLARQQSTLAAVWWDARDPADSPFGADTRPPTGRDVPSAWGDAQLTVLLALTNGLGSSIQAVALVSGEIDVATVPALHAAARAVAAAAHPQPSQSVVLVLDLAGVTFLDSSGLHLLEALHADGLERGWVLQVIPPAAPALHDLLCLAANRGWLPPNLLQRHPSPATAPDAATAA